MRKEFDRRNQKIYAVHKQSMKVRDLAQRFWLSERRVWGICKLVRMRMHARENMLQGSCSSEAGMEGGDNKGSKG